MNEETPCFNFLVAGPEVKNINNKKSLYVYE